MNNHHASDARPSAPLRLVPKGGAAAAIEVNGLSKIFEHERRFSELLRRRTPQRTLAVDTMSFHVDDGEVLGLVGPNGAGKTTLLRLMSTLLVPSAGTARIAGFDVLSQAQDVRRCIGLVASNERSFFWRLTGRQNLRFFADLYHLPWRETAAWTEELLDLLGLRSVADQRFEAYSTGTKQRFAIARGLLHRPRVLFMDEPTKGVDPKSSAEIISLIRDRVVTQARQTVIITTHNLREIEQLCQRTLIMEQGQMAYLGTTDELKRMVHRRDAFRIRLAQVPSGLLQALQRLCAGAVQQPEPGLLELALPEQGASLDDVMRLITAANCGLQDCSRVEMPIEEAFVAFIAKRRQGGQQDGRQGGPLEAPPVVTPGTAGVVDAVDAAHAADAANAPHVLDAPHTAGVPAPAAQRELAC